MIRRLLRRQQGAVAILMALAFMVLGVPVITSALGLASSISIDSRVKTDILQRQYCRLGIREYIRYLSLDPNRWLAWWSANPSGEENFTFCQEQIQLTAETNRTN